MILEVQLESTENVVVPWKSPPVMLITALPKEPTARPPNLDPKK